MKKISTFILFLLTLQICYTQAPDRSTPPPLGKVKPLQLPALQRFTLSNGLSVLLMEKHNVPLVQVNLLIQTGSFDDPIGKEGIASFAMDLLDEGAGSYGALQLADEIEFLGAEIRTMSRSFYSEVNCAAPVSKLDAVLTLMSTIALKPNFSTAEIERIQKLRLNGLLQNYDDPNTIATRAFNKYMFTEASPYGRFANEGSIRSYSREELVAFHKSHFTTGNSKLIVVGDVTQGSIQPTLEKYFAALGSSALIKKTRPTPSQVKGRPIYVVDKPGAAQSVIRIGRLGPERSNVDYYSLNALNTILGGSFTSRLNNNLREQHGYAYGAGSSFSFWNVPSPFIASSSVQTDVTGPALGEFFNEFKKIRMPIPSEEVNRGKSYNALGYAGDFETNANLADALGDLFLNQLPDNYFNSYIEKVLAVSKKELESSAKKYILPENMLVVIVGDRSKIEAGIKKLNLGTINFVLVEDVLGKKPKL